MASNNINKLIARTFFKNFFEKTENLSQKKGPSRFGHYSLIEPQQVSAKRDVPAYIPKPTYAETGEPMPPPSEPEIKTKNQIECMAHSCILARRVLREIKSILKPGITTDFVDHTIHEMIINQGAYPSTLNYRGFPKSVCTSINNVACHGIPDDRPLQDGDILNIDVTVFFNGYHGDCSEMYEIGTVDEQGKDLIKIAKLCMQKGMDICKPNEKFCNIGTMIEETAKKHGYNIFPAFGGHGIGQYFHGPPDIYHFANDGEGVMKPGMTFTIEPIVTQGREEVVVLEDEWTAVSLDNARSAQFENTILITENGYDILTS
ncbi:methionine aminopeptidase 1D, mitochondrial [Trichogramma pretiosum]|uniref:methionine aminopeptidase 1D, mitochondrial n=1 Tax=Trichogramma pretiosum TaxID=7493 RepID=UPI0006C96F10|nr:methionine aminopeptidase 1D, mitochondrial [Trichogramma pretiosum]